MGILCGFLVPPSNQEVSTACSIFGYPGSAGVCIGSSRRFLSK